MSGLHLRWNSSVLYFFNLISKYSNGNYPLHFLNQEVHDEPGRQRGHQ
jgi:hypothetical protein